MSLQRGGGGRYVLRGDFSAALPTLRQMQAYGICALPFPYFHSLDSTLAAAVRRYGDMPGISDVRYRLDSAAWTFRLGFDFDDPEALNALLAAGSGKAENYYRMPKKGQLLKSDKFYPSRLFPTLAEGSKFPFPASFFEGGQYRFTFRANKKIKSYDGPEGIFVRQSHVHTLTFTYPFQALREGRLGAELSIRFR